MLNCNLQMLPPQVPNWITTATAHLANLTSNIEKRSPPPARSPTPPPSQPSDPDTPLNLSKPKSSSSGSPGSSPSSVPVSLQNNPVEQPMTATAPKFLPPSLMVPRALLPYHPASLPTQFSPLPPNTERHKNSKDGLLSPEKQPHFPMHMYGLPTHQQMPKTREDSVSKEDTDFLTACHSKLFENINLFHVSNTNKI